MIDLIICDDNALHNQTLVHHLTQMTHQLDLPLNIAFVTTQGEEIIGYAKSAAAGKRLYMLDLVLEQPCSGLDLCQSIHQYDPDGCVLYVSAYPEYALECCQSHSFDFILKPYTRERLEESVKAAIHAILRPEYLSSLIVRNGSRMEKLDQSQIYYIQAQRDYVTAYFEVGKLSWCEGLGKLEKHLNPDWFRRVHKSYLVNARHIKSYDLKTQEVILSNDAVLPISRRYASTLKKRMG